MFRKICQVLLVSGLVLLAAGGLCAQTSGDKAPRDLQPETWVPGKLRAGNEYWYSVIPAETGLVTVETSGSTDTYLEAYDSSRILIGKNDDGGTGYNARLEIIAEGGKTYLFKLKGYDETESGPYKIRTVFSALRELTLDSSIPGKLRADEEQWFRIQPPESGYLIVETSGDSDTCLEAFNASGTSLAEDDDGGMDYNARLEFFVEGGTIYRIKLSHYEDEDAPYQIQASLEPLPPDTDRNTERGMAVPVKLGEPNPVFLRSPSESRWYRYDIARNGTLFVVQTRGNLDTIVTLYDAQGNQLFEDDDSGEGDNARISEKLASGTVYIEVREYDGQVGRCTLHAEIR